MVMRSHVYLLTLSFLFLTQLSANTNLRHWVMENDKKIHAELIGYDEAEDKVHLRIDEREDSYYQLGDFSTIDKAWLVQWLEVSEALDAKLDSVPGQFTHYNFQGEHSIYDFYVYEPSGVLQVSQRPIMLLLSAGPNGRRYLLRHIDAAEATNMVIVAIDRFGNTQSSQASIEQRLDFAELLPIIESNIAHDSRQVFLGGTSGGALRAHLISCLIERPWRGIYSNGGWLGYESHIQESYPAIPVAMVNGNNDRAANAYVERDTELLQKSGATIALFSFEGGHQIPPTKSLIKAFDWLLKPEEFTGIDG